MQVTHTIRVNLRHPWRPEEIYVKQGDINSRQLKFDIYNGAAPWNVPAGTLAEFHAYKPDNTFCDIDATISGNSVYVLLGEQVTAVAGPVKAEVTLTNGGEVLSTFLVYLNVQSQAVPDDAIESAVEITAYREIVEDMSEIYDDTEGIRDDVQGLKEDVEEMIEQIHVMQGAPLVATTVAEMTDTDRVYVYTGSEAGYTAGSWYYYDGAAWTLGGVYNSVAVQTDPTLTLTGQAADAKATGDAINAVKNELIVIGDEITFPSTYTGNVFVEEIDGAIYTGGRNIIPLVGFKEGTYTSETGITFVVEKNAIVINGTTTANTYFQPHTGVTSNAGISDRQDYDLPEQLYYFVGEFENASQSQVTVAVRSQASGNIVTLSSKGDKYADLNYDNDTCATIYVYLPSGVTYTNAKVTIGITTHDADGRNAVTEYNPISVIDAVGSNDLSAYSFLDGTARVYESENAFDQLRNELEQEINAISGKKYLRYIAGAGDDSSTERVEVYIQSTVGYIRYDFLHTVNLSRNADVWRIGNAYAVDSSLSERFALTTPGEWECAVHLKDRTDFSGGYAHGDEVMDDVTFFIDGVPIDITGFTTLQEFDTFKIVQTSDLYDPEDSVTVIAKHGSEHIFDDEVIINQTLIWQVAEVLTNCYLAMFPPAKTVTDSLYTDRDYTISTLDGTRQTIMGAKESVEYSEDVGFNAVFSIKEYPANLDIDGDYFLTTDNNGGSYNKCYYVITTGAGNKTSAVGERWKSSTLYNLSISK